MVVIFLDLKTMFECLLQNQVPMIIMIDHRLRTISTQWIIDKSALKSINTEQSCVRVFPIPRPYKFKSKPLVWHLRLSSHLDIAYCTTNQKLDLSITVRILLLKYCNASPSSSDTHGAPLPLCRALTDKCFFMEEQ